MSKLNKLLEQHYELRNDLIKDMNWSNIMIQNSNQIIDIYMDTSIEEIHNKFMDRREFINEYAKKDLNKFEESLKINHNYIISEDKIFLMYMLLFYYYCDN